MDMFPLNDPLQIPGGVEGLVSLRVEGVQYMLSPRVDSQVSLQQPDKHPTKIQLLVT